MRLDVYLTIYYNIQSRNKSAELIKDKKVKVNGYIITKSSFKVKKNSNIKILKDEFYVSRAAYKLKYFLQEINIDLQDNHALDIGSSTGGFTQILLQNNVQSVTCVDVGNSQLHKNIKNNRKIIIKENKDIRKFKSDMLYDIITCDVSFISILHILDDINRLANDKIIILYKPQFEVGNSIKRNRAGVVQDEKAILKEKENFLKESKNYKWRLVYNATSQLSGKNGNLEELFYFKKEY
jgi:23S rRNA (cytidine1920-2'-O)/16S rRNA (cytidine1409-2'-O)-methyltransferase